LGRTKASGAAPLESNVENPYASPCEADGGGARPTELTATELRRRALARVANPAAALIVSGWLAIGVVAAAIGSIVLDWINGRTESLGALGGIAGVLAAMAYYGCMIVGGVKMKRLQSYSWSVAAAVLAMNPCVCCYLTFPFGIWAILVLNESVVRDGFDLPPSEATA